ncbi:hypothetical protein C3L33_09357, partial [Rhododendron williamsianum]
MNHPTVQIISECFIKPEEQNHPPIYLAPWDLAMLSVHYIQKGLLFIKPQAPTTDHQENHVESLLNRLKDSLSRTLVHFYPLSGRLATHKQENPPSYSVYIDCDNSPGAKFVYAAADLTVSDILSPVDVPVVVQSFFDHDRAVNHDGHSMSLLSIQVTELTDGIFIGCSINHMVVDGTSYWHFFEMLSHAFHAQEKNPEIPRPPVLTAGFPRESIAKLKSKANSESKTNKISSFQAVSTLVWRCVTRARRLPHDQETSCRLAANNRARMDPPLPAEYFGNLMQTVSGKASAGELLGHGFGWAAWRLHEAVAGHCDTAVREWV